MNGRIYRKEVDNDVNFLASPLQKGIETFLEVLLNKTFLLSYDPVRFEVLA
jgi:hypothetical protein